MFGWLSNSAPPVQSESTGLSELTNLMGSTSPSIFPGSARSQPSRRLLADFNIGPGWQGSPQDATKIVSELARLEEQKAGEDEEAKKLHKVKVSLQQDGYGLLVMRIVYWWDGCDSAVFWTHHGMDYEGSFLPQPMLALVHAICVFFVTLVTQIGITLMLYRNSKNLMEHWAKFAVNHNGLTINQASAAVSQSVAAGNLDQGLIDECKTLWSIRDNEVFAFVLLLWTAKMIPEFKMAKNSLRELMSIDTGKSGREPMLSLDGCTVLRTSCFLRAILALFIPALRFLVAFLIFIAGCDFICSQHNTGDVVIKGMCMAFVTDIDTIFLRAFASEGAQRKLESFRLLVHQENSPFGAMIPQLWEHGLGGLTYSLFALLCVCYQTGFLGYAREVPFLDHEKAQLYQFRVTCNEYCSQNAGQCG